MAEKLTPAQSRAVSDRGGKLLVSAAAGRAVAPLPRNWCTIAGSSQYARSRVSRHCPSSDRRS